VFELVRDPEADLTDQPRAVLAVVALHLGSIGDAVPARGLIKAIDNEIAEAALPSHSTSSRAGVFLRRPCVLGVRHRCRRAGSGQKLGRMR